ncbi:alpha/beta hydrolase [Mycolicibacterium sp. P1-18]|uniref:alpha/beta hydrolase n=1 Tax=Mycolicibacterium sp. P1-18 TaxID=2024615 RepID=UPI001F5C00B0|nr:alpha/beta hydrolase [Mycolicibacterium sp. P1-18]
MRFTEIAGRTSDVSMPTRYGAVAATVYHPPPDVEHPAVYLNVHGGGFVVGHPEQDDPWCRYLAAHAGVAVVNPDYVLAPKHRFPAAAHQVYDIACWAADGDRKWDGTRLCVGGQSAGGNLAAATARQALENHGPDIALQVLFYAPLDLVTATRDKPSTIGARAVMKPWMSEVFDTAYIPDPAMRHDRLASPARDDQARLAGIAPALVITAEQDRLRDEARRYAEMLGAAGSLVEYYEAIGVDHGYNVMSSATDVTRATYDKICDHVVRATADPTA